MSHDDKIEYLRVSAAELHRTTERIVNAELRQYNLRLELKRLNEDKATLLKNVQDALTALDALPADGDVPRRARMLGKLVITAEHYGRAHP